jgi:recombination protein RecR
MLDSIVQNLIDELSKLPAVGPKSAQRIAFWVMSQPSNNIMQLVHSLEDIKTKAKYCEICGNITQNQYCDICLDKRRDSSKICIVEEVKDLVAIERTNEYRGKYHVLGGVLDPAKGITPASLRFSSLWRRIEDPNNKIQEIILGTNPSVMGRSTANYITEKLEPFDLSITRLAQGIPMGSEIEYADEMTLSEAMTYRQTLKGASNN